MKYELETLVFYHIVDQSCPWEGLPPEFSFSPGRGKTIPKFLKPPSRNVQCVWKFLAVDGSPELFFQVTCSSKKWPATTARVPATKCPQPEANQFRSPSSKRQNESASKTSQKHKESSPGFYDSQTQNKNSQQLLGPSVPEATGETGLSKWQPRCNHLPIHQRHSWWWPK